MLHATTAGALGIRYDVDVLRDGSSWAQTAAPSESRVLSLLTCEATTTSNVAVTRHNSTISR